MLSDKEKIIFMLPKSDGMKIVVNSLKTLLLCTAKCLDLCIKLSHGYYSLRGLNCKSNFSILPLYYLQ